jgi:hypothetical protein
MITFTADKFELRDANGVVRVSIGTTENVSVAAYMFHFTKDGQYVDGAPITNAQSQDNEYAHKIAQTYEGCHAWVCVDKQWMSLPAVALPWERWSPELTTNIPECVRVAEYVREKS